MQSNKQLFQLTAAQQAELQSFSQSQLQELHTTETNDNVAEAIIEKLHEILGRNLLYVSKEILQKMLTDSGIEINEHIESELNEIQRRRKGAIVNMLKDLTKPEFANDNSFQYIVTNTRQEYFPFLESSDIPLNNAILILDAFKKELLNAETYEDYQNAKTLVTKRVMISEGFSHTFIEGLQAAGQNKGFEI
jgi:hypothetical protein